MRELLTGKNVLVVDDDNDYAEALDEIFTLQGCTVTRFCDPVAAMNEALKKDYDLIIVDKNMPNVDGLEFAENIRHRKPDCQIVLITAYPNAVAREKSRDIGIRYFLSKPFRKQEILEIASFVML